MGKSMVDKILREATLNELFSGEKAFEFKYFLKQSLGTFISLFKDKYDNSVVLRISKSSAYDGLDAYDVWFTVNHTTDEEVNRNNPARGDKANYIGILNNVVYALKTFIEKKRPDILEFTAADSKYNIYKGIHDRLNYGGYRFLSNDGVNFLVKDGVEFDHIAATEDTGYLYSESIAPGRLNELMDGGLKFERSSLQEQGGIVYSSFEDQQGNKIVVTFESADGTIERKGGDYKADFTFNGIMEKAETDEPSKVSTGTFIRIINSVFEAVQEFLRKYEPASMTVITSSRKEGVQKYKVYKMVFAKLNLSDYHISDYDNTDYGYTQISLERK